MPRVPIQGYFVIAKNIITAIPEGDLANDNSGNIVKIMNADTSSAQLNSGKLAGSIPEGKLANDNTGSLISIMNADTSSVQLNSGKLAGSIPEGKIANDNTGNLISIMNADTSSVQLNSGKLAGSIPEGKIANDNTGNLISIMNADTSTTTLSLSKLAALVSSFNTRTGAVVPASGDYNPQQVGFASGFPTSTPIPLSALAALVSAFNGRTGAVVPAAGDYVHTFTKASTTSFSLGSSTVISEGNVVAGPNGTILVFGVAVATTPIYFHANGTTGPSLVGGSSAEFQLTTYTSSITTSTGAPLCIGIAVVTGLTSGTSYIVGMKGGASASTVEAYNIVAIGI